MRIVLSVPMLMIVACAGAELIPTPGATATLDGTYSGTGQNLTNICGSTNPFPITTTVKDGTATVTLPTGRRVTSRVAADGSVSDVRFSDPQFIVNGDGRVEGGRLAINLTSQLAGGRGSCSFRYTGQRQG
jgi:hypothetical protein